ncbi:hypothetical protein ARMGADRAFT_292426 [Armillaria gallica]|uniref:Uncharacterized protein n=1 Tax=Armillaria gallica TaxID=47427 RepID=A0A2H3DR82_ARMGA|nr:hypothetical protein ARMGADRAFT_292426 [Armillaria gallica]
MQSGGFDSNRRLNLLHRNTYNNGTSLRGHSTWLAMLGLWTRPFLIGTLCRYTHHTTCRTFLRRIMDYHISSLRVAQRHHQCTEIWLTCQIMVQLPSSTPRLLLVRSRMLVHKSHFGLVCVLWGLNDSQVTPSRCSSEVTLTVTSLGLRK